jgi:hypothetical protein
VQARRLARHAFAVGITLAALAVVRGSASGGPQRDDGVAPGTVAFFTGTACPPGWATADYATGRLAVGVTDGAAVRLVVGAPLNDQEDRVHAHHFSGNATLSAKSIAAADGSNNQGAAAMTYALDGSAAGASGLPFIQLLACEKQP